MGSFVENVNKMASLTPTNVEDLNLIVQNIDAINQVAPLADDLNDIVNNIVPNLAEILLADNNATIATEQALLATTNGAAQVALATTQAGIAAAKAGEASTSASQALAYKDLAFGYRNEAETFAGSINPNSLVENSIHASSSKTTPVDADEIGLIDSASTFTVKKLTWANLKATLKTYLDTLYQSTLVSGTNIKTINSSSILGSGDLVITAGISLVTANSYDLGVGQTWQDVTASRSAGVTYTNSTGKPIQIFFGCLTGVSKVVSFIVDGKSVNIGFGATGYYDASTCNVIVPNGSTYGLALPAPTGTATWLELR